MSDIRSVAVIGGGPAGLTSGLYLARGGVDVVLVDDQMTGGQAAMSPMIENYPGFPDGIEGPELIFKMKEQAERFGLEIKTFAKVTAITDGGKVKTVRFEDSDLEANAVIIATGRSPKKLGIPGEEEFTGKGISYCATCDGPLFKEKTVMVVGGGDAAVEEALYLTSFASKVIVAHRRDDLRASSYLKERALSHPKMEFMWNTELEEVRGQETVDTAVVVNNVTRERSEVPVAGVFMYVGNVPNSGFVKDQVEIDESGYIITDEKLETSIPGIFAAGDVRSQSFKQVVVCAGEGALAALSAQRHLESIGAREAYEGDQ